MNANLLEVRYLDPRIARASILVGRTGERGGFASIYLHDGVVWFQSHDGERFGVPVERCVELIPEKPPPLPTMPDPEVYAAARARMREPILRDPGKPSGGGVLPRWLRRLTKPSSEA